MGVFMKGLELSERFYREVVRGLLGSFYPRLKYSAGLIGGGSEVLGFDTPTSTDHNWGPRLIVFLSDEDLLTFGDEISSTLSKNLPGGFRGFSTSYGSSEGAQRTRFAEAPLAGSINHLIEFFSTETFLRRYLGIEPWGSLSASDWLVLEEHKLLGLTSGAVFHDGLGELHSVRAKFAYYPTDLWLYLMASQWQRIAQERAFVGRCGDVGDELGSSIVASRLVRDLMRLCFLMERQYVPYPKWFGTAFSRLKCSSRLTPILTRAACAASWKEREQCLSVAYTVAGEMQNGLGIAGPVGVEIANYYERPYLVVNADDFVEALLAAVQNDEVRAIRRPIGSVNHFVDSTDVLDNAELCQRLRPVYL